MCWGIPGAPRIPTSQGRRSRAPGDPKAPPPPCAPRAARRTPRAAARAPRRSLRDAVNVDCSAKQLRPAVLKMPLPVRPRVAVSSSPKRVPLKR
eukprot:gene9075-biopygen3184